MKIKFRRKQYFATLENNLVDGPFTKWQAKKIVSRHRKQGRGAILAIGKHL